MARNKGGGRVGLVPNRYQVHDPDTGLFMKVNTKTKSVAPKWSPGPFSHIRIRETIEKALEDNFIAASAAAARKQRERDAERRKATKTASKKAAQSPIRREAAKRKAAAKASLEAAKRAVRAAKEDARKAAAAAKLATRKAEKAVALAAEKAAKAEALESSLKAAGKPPTTVAAKHPKSGSAAVNSPKETSGRANGRTYPRRGGHSPADGAEQRL